MNIGDLVKRRRIDLNLTQDELAEASKVTQPKISQIENGTSDNVTIAVLRKLAKALNCLVIDLLPDKDKLKTK